MHLVVPKARLAPARINMSNRYLSLFFSSLLYTLIICVEISPDSSTVERCLNQPHGESTGIGAGVGHIQRKVGNPSMDVHYQIRREVDSAF